MPAPTVLRFDKVTKVFPGCAATPALDELSFALAPGEFTALVGPPGSGKSTVLNLAAALDRATSGEIECGGERLGGRADGPRGRRGHLGFVIQPRDVHPMLTVLENVEYTALVRGDDPRATRRRATAALADLGLAGRATCLPTQLSGGQQPRVAIARALVSQPKLVLADDPTADLDSSSSAQLIDLLIELNRQRGVTFLFSSRDERLIRRARRRLSLRDGRLVGDDRADRPN